MMTKRTTCRKHTWGEPRWDRVKCTTCGREVACDKLAHLDRMRKTAAMVKAIRTREE